MALVEGWLHSGLAYGCIIERLMVYFVVRSTTGFPVLLVLFFEIRRERMYADSGRLL
jgi:hypothetical protein